MNKIIIAIDGYSSCGKSTFAKAIAAQLSYVFIDSGAMYRAVTLYAMRHHLTANGEVKKELIVAALPSINIRMESQGLGLENSIFLNDEDVTNAIRQPDVSANVSRVSEVAVVRERMVELQQKMGERKGVVMDGRDIGTVVFPHAELKIFMTAAPEIRAQRRFQELQAKGVPSSLDEVESSIRRRDHIDETRDIAPLKKASDAIILDNSHLSVAQQ
ncbi:MAG: (d)CMP kinase, partial [Prevotellaceae bacterium]|nr:(d)CMP kinase [Prevotellaceae bacterium]